MPDLFERILLLKQSPMFSEVSTEDLRVVAQMLEEESYFTGDRIFDIDENGDNMYILQSGSIGISLNSDPTIKEFVVELGPGECFGEMNLLDELPRSATAHVLEDSTVVGKISPEGFDYQLSRIKYRHVEGSESALKNGQPEKL